MNIAELFFEAAEKYPHHVAIVDKKRTISYAGLQQEIKETVAYFKQKGIAAGDRVLVFVPMSIDLYRVVLSLFFMGATAVFLDEWVSKKTIGTLL
ncbi:MAG: AMP-binding protein [Bacteroidales bacterium]|nr:AMP-binding protein [Bacteroidales bacterium]